MATVLDFSSSSRRKQAKPTRLSAIFGAPPEAQDPFQENVEPPSANGDLRLEDGEIRPRQNGSAANSSVHGSEGETDSSVVDLSADRRYVLNPDPANQWRPVFPDLVNSSQLPDFMTRPRNDPSADDYCEVCKKHFCNKYYLRKHMKDIHHIVMENTPQESPEKDLQQQQLQQHKQQQQQQQSRDADLAKQFSQPLNPMFMPWNPLLSNPDMAQIMKNLIQQQHQAKEDARAESQVPEFRCHHCPASFPNEYVLQLHQMESHAAPRQPPPPSEPTCDLCVPPKSFSSLQMLQIHRNMAHTEQQMQDQPFMSRIDLRTGETHPARGIFSSNSENGDGASPNMTAKLAERVQCDVCNKFVCNKYFLKVHKTRVHGISVEEQKAQAAAKQQQEMPLLPNMTRAQPPGGLPQSAGNLPLSIPSQVPLQAPGALPHPVSGPPHLTQQVSLKREAVKLEPAASRPPMKMSRLEDRTVHCNICNKELYNRWFLRSHKMKAHSLVEELSAEEKSQLEGQLECQCAACGQIFPGVAEFFNHINSVHGEIVSTLPSPHPSDDSRTSEVRYILLKRGWRASKSSPRGAPSKCTSCPRRFRHAASLREHCKVSGHAVPSPRRRLACRQCRAEFLSREEGQRHVRQMHRGNEQTFTLQPVSLNTPLVGGPLKVSMPVRQPLHETITVTFTLVPECKPVFPTPPLPEAAQEEFSAPASPEMEVTQYNNNDEHYNNNGELYNSNGVHYSNSVEHFGKFVEATFQPEGVVEMAPLDKENFSTL